jgi:hypothetical protein
MTGRENFAKLLANIGMETKMKTADPQLTVELIFLTPAVETLNKRQVMFKPVLEAIKEAKKAGIKNSSMRSSYGQCRFAKRRY